MSNIHVMKALYFKVEFNVHCFSEHEQVALKIRKFLKLADREGAPVASEVGNGDDHSSSTSDESFEKIDTADLVNEEVGTPDEVREIPKEIHDVGDQKEEEAETKPSKEETKA